MKIFECARVQQWCHFSRRNKTKISVSLCLCLLLFRRHLLLSRLRCRRRYWLARCSFVNRRNRTAPEIVASHVLYLFPVGHLHEKCVKLPVCFRHDGLLSAHFSKLGSFESGWTQCNQGHVLCGHPGACSGLRSGAWLCKRNNGRLGAF